MDAMARMNAMVRRRRSASASADILYNDVAVRACPGRFFFRTEDVSGFVTRTRCMDFILDVGTIPREPRKGDRIVHAGRSYEVNAPSGEPVWVWSGTFQDAYRVHTTGQGEALQIDYLTFVSVTEGSGVSLDRHGSPYEIGMEYRIGRGSGEWLPYTWGEDGRGIQVSLSNPGDACQFRAVSGGNERFSINGGNYWGFTVTGYVRASGSIMTLFDQDDVSRSMAGRCLIGLFYQQAGLVTSPEFPATELSQSCYQNVFYKAGISVPPVLPAEEQPSGATHAYDSMFRETQHMPDAGELPLIELGQNVCSDMFNGSKVTRIAVRFKDWKHDLHGTYNWMLNVPVGGTFTCPPELPVEFGPSAIPWGWLVHNSLSEPTEEEIVNACYEHRNNSLSLRPEFKACLDREEQVDYVVDGKTYWRAGTPLPNPSHPEWDDHYKLSGNGFLRTFKDMTHVVSLDLSRWDTSQVTDMKYMFNGCSSLTSLDVSGWNTSQVTYMSYMFSDCSQLSSLDLSGWDTSKVTDMYAMFYGCSQLSSLDLSGWNTSQVTDMKYMFFGCNAVTTAYGRTQADCDKLNGSYDKPGGWMFVVRPGEDAA